MTPAEFCATIWILAIPTGILWISKMKERETVKIRYNEDEQVVARIREGLLKKEGYCPCRLQRTEENRCMCLEFREQIADPEFEGYCHCRLYYKEK